MDTATSPPARPKQPPVDESARLPEDQRSGSPRSLAAAWSGILLGPGTIVTGMVAAGGSAGPGFVIGFGGLALGVVVGVVGVAFLSLWGPRTGMAQMALGRLAFGRFNVVPQVFLIASLIAYNMLSDLYSVDALADALDIPFIAALAAVLAVEVTVLVFGVKLMRSLGLVVTVVMVVICAALIVGAADVPAAPAPPGSPGFPVGPFLLAVGLGLSSSISWTVQACDLSRVLPADTPPSAVFRWVLIGMGGPLLVLGGIGAWISSNSALANPMGRVDQILGGGLLATVALVALGTSLGLDNAFNDYSGGLSLRQLGLPFSRVTCSLMVAAAGVSLALVARGTNLGNLTSDVVLFAGYYAAPWFGVLLVELALRRGEPRPWQIPAGAARAALVAFGVAYFLLLPFTATPVGDTLAADQPIPFAWFGWVSRTLLDGGDGGYLAGFAFGVGLYALLRRRWYSPQPEFLPAH